MSGDRSTVAKVKSSNPRIESRLRQDKGFRPPPDRAFVRRLGTDPCGGCRATPLRFQSVPFPGACAREGLALGLQGAGRAGANGTAPDALTDVVTCGPEGAAFHPSALIALIGLEISPFHECCTAQRHSDIERNARKDIESYCNLRYRDVYRSALQEQSHGVHAKEGDAGLNAL